MPLQRTQKEIRQRAPLWLVGLLALNFALMTVSARDPATNERKIRGWAQAAAYPFQSLFSGAGNAGVGFFGYLGSLRTAAAENDELKRRLAESDAKLGEAVAVREENGRLQALLGLQESAAYKTVAARAIARDPSQWFDSVIINRGSSAGIEVNMPVVTADGVVGRVAALSAVTAQVMLITDERAAAGAVVGQLDGSNALGSVRGFGANGLLEMRYVSGLEEVKLGDTVTTTGQDGIYPRGIKVGAVVEWKPGTATQPHEIKVRPGARLNALSEVTVLLYRPPPRTVPTPAPSPTPNDKGKK